MTKKVVDYKAKVIFLHGFTQLALAFYAKTLALRKKLLQLKLKAVYLNAPFELTPAQLPTTDSLSRFGAVQDSDNNLAMYRAWWLKKADNTYEIESAIETVRKYMNENAILNEETGKYEAQDEEDAKLPVSGIIGFSQGACFGGAMVHRFEELFGAPLNFAVLYSGFKIDTTIMPQNKSYYCSDDGALSKTRLLHVIGELDTVVSEERSLSFYETTKKNLDVLKHPGGHFVPNSKVYVEKVANWIQNEQLETKEAKKDDLDDILAMMDKVGV